jgi:hypothetical protein
MSKLDWFAVERDALAPVLLGVNQVGGRRRADPYTVGENEVLLGISTTSPFSDNGVPTILLLRDEHNDLLSWFATYAEEVFPLSQFVRVGCMQDWASGLISNADQRQIGAIGTVWPSIVLGEMLGQSSLEPDITSIPLSRASACYSFALARTALLYPDDERTRNTCVERLMHAEQQSRFGRRPVTTNVLRRAWMAALAVERVPLFRGGDDFAAECLQLVSGVSPQAALLIDRRELLSDSAEERVAGFDLAIASLDAVPPADPSGRDTRAVTVAAAALLAGRGTSHLHLLNPSARDTPEAFVWFGLFAGALGPRHWDTAWMQQAKGVERALRQAFRFDDPVQADICWIEYEWLSRTFPSAEVLTGFPRSFPSGLSIEIVPGAVCQFRLGEQGSSNRSTADARRDLPNHREEGRVARAIELLTEAQRVLRSADSGTGQGSLFSEGADRRSQKDKRKRSSQVRGQSPPSERK